MVLLPALRWPAADPWLGQVARGWLARAIYGLEGHQRAPGMSPSASVRCRRAHSLARSASARMQPLESSASYRRGQLDWSNRCKEFRADGFLRRWVLRPPCLTVRGLGRRQDEVAEARRPVSDCKPLRHSSASSTERNLVSVAMGVHSPSACMRAMNRMARIALTEHDAGEEGDAEERVAKALEPRSSADRSTCPRLSGSPASRVVFTPGTGRTGRRSRSPARRRPRPSP